MKLIFLLVVGSFILLLFSPDNIFAQSNMMNNLLAKDFPVTLSQDLVSDLNFSSTTLRSDSLTIEEKRKHRLLASSILCCSGCIGALIITANNGGDIEDLGKKDILVWFAVGITCGFLTWVISKG